MPSVSPSELLLAASALGDKEIVQQLLEREDTDPHTVDLRNRSAPMLAAKQGHDDIIRMLLPHMATPMETWTDLFGLSMLDVAIRTENLSTVRLVTETTDALFNARDRHGDTPLVLASKQQPPSTALIQLLLEGGAEVEVIDDDGRSPLHHVTASGNNVEALRLLLDALPARSADEPPKELLTPCDCGITVDPEQRSIFWTWVHPTATDVKPRYGPVIDLMDDRGWTPLKLALHHGRTELAELLTSHGASPVEVTEKSEQNNFPIRFC
ncbi:ankyrin repeat-containing domain protein [Aspergillus egyptiacus]|nr:ankyrin repeat-containing domain protein [Aspergillus egyptiacus]